MSYEINGQRITRWSRERLLRELERLHQESLNMEHRLLTERERGASMRKECDDVIRDRVTERVECAKAEAEKQEWKSSYESLSRELDGAVEQRDKFRREATDNWLKLTTAEEDLSRLRAEVKGLHSRRAKWEIAAQVAGAVSWLIFCLAVGVWVFA